MGHITPKNGIYITRSDFEQYQEKFSKELGITEIDMGVDGCLRPIRHEFESNDYDVVVKNVTFVVTERCNLACTYCYEAHKTQDRMTKEVAKNAVDLMFDQERLKDYYNLNQTPAVILDFIGGEPLLEIDLMDYIVEYFKFKAFELDHPWQYNYMISVSTNGTLFKSRKVQQFMKRNPGKVSMSISVDGDEDLHDSCRVFHNGKGSHSKVAESVRMLVNDTCGHSATKITISPDNIQYLDKSIFHLFEDLGLGGANGGWVYEKGWKVEDSTVGYEKLKKVANWLLDGGYATNYIAFFEEQIGTRRDKDQNYCGGHGLMLAISPQGYASPCLRYFNYSLQRNPQQVIGDVWEGLESRAENKWLNELKDITMTSQSPPKCQDCPIAQGCGGCTAYNYDYTGSPNIKGTFSCKMHRARVLANVYYWNLLYKQLGINKVFEMNIPMHWALEIISEDEYWYLDSLVQASKARMEEAVAA